MKKFVLLTITFILLFSNRVFSKWEIVKVSQDIHYSKIACPGENNSIMIGSDVMNNEFIDRTTDGGLTWTRVFSDTLSKNNIPKELYFISYPDTNLCYVTSDSGIVYKSTNNGNTWEVIQFEKLTNQYISAFNEKYLVKEELYFNSAKGIFYWSNDSGKNWNLFNIPPEYNSYMFNSFSIFAENSIIFSLISEDGDIIFLKTTDNGENWIKFQAFEHSSIQFVNNEIGFAKINTSDNPYLYTLTKTNDGGNTWNILTDSLLFGKRNIRYFFSDENNGIVYCNILYFIITKDGGSTWEKVPISDLPFSKIEIDNSLIYDLSFVNSSCFYSIIVTYSQNTGRNYNIVKYTKDPESVIEFDLQNEISFFPNPIKAGDNLKFKNVPLNEEFYNIKLFNFIGNVVYDNKINLSEINEGLYIPKDISDGLYFITISGNNFIKTGKIIVND